LAVYSSKYTHFLLIFVMKFYAGKALSYPVNPCRVSFPSAVLFISLLIFTLSIIFRFVSRNEGMEYPVFLAYHSTGIPTLRLIRASSEFG